MILIYENRNFVDEPDYQLYFCSWHVDMLPIYQLGGGQGDNDMFPEVDSNWKVCEKCLSSDI